MIIAWSLIFIFLLNFLFIIVEFTLCRIFLAIKIGLVIWCNFSLMGIRRSYHLSHFLFKNRFLLNLRFCSFFLLCNFFLLCRHVLSLLSSQFWCCWFLLCSLINWLSFFDLFLNLLLKLSFRPYLTLKLPLSLALLLRKHDNLSLEIINLLLQSKLCDLNFKLVCLCHWIDVLFQLLDYQVFVVLSVLQLPQLVISCLLTLLHRILKRGIF